MSCTTLKCFWASKEKGSEGSPRSAHTSHSRDFILFYLKTSLQSGLTMRGDVTPHCLSAAAATPLLKALQCSPGEMPTEQCSSVKTHGWAAGRALCLHGSRAGSCSHTGAVPASSAAPCAKTHPISHPMGRDSTPGCSQPQGAPSPASDTAGMGHPSHTALLLLLISHCSTAAIT